MTLDKNDLKQIKDIVVEVVDKRIEASEKRIISVVDQKIQSSEKRIISVVDQKIEASENRVISVISREIKDLAENIQPIMKITDNHEQRITHIETNLKIKAV